jgi:hypothetical protein
MPSVEPTLLCEHLQEGLSQSGRACEDCRPAA